MLFVYFFPIFVLFPWSKQKNTNISIKSATNIEMHSKSIQGSKYISSFLDNLSECIIYYFGYWGGIYNMFKLEN